MGNSKDIIELLTDGNCDPAIYFCESVHEIFANTKSYITGICEQLDRKVLIELRQKLFEKLCNQHPIFASHELCNRRTKKKLKEDIYVIGNSLVNALEDKKLRKLFKNGKQSENDSTVLSDSDGESDNASLLEVCASLKTTVAVLMNKVTLLESRIKTLESESTKSKDNNFKLDELLDESEPSIVSDAQSIIDLDMDDVPNTAEQQQNKKPNKKITVIADVHKDINGVPQPCIKKKSTVECDEISVRKSPSKKSKSFPYQPKDEFTHTTHQRRNILKSTKMKNGTNNPPKKPVIGESIAQFKVTAASANSEPGTRSYLVYVGKLSKDTDQRLIREHLLQIGVYNEDIADIIQLNCRNENETSFCISIHTHHVRKIIYTPQNWPKGVKIRPFQPAIKPNKRHTSVSRKHSRTFWSSLRDSVTNTGDMHNQYYRNRSVNRYTGQERNRYYHNQDYSKYYEDYPQSRNNKQSKSWNY